ncbi:MAG: glycoside hydrolase family 28 protein, partial [Lachnospiraceae bacterium]|nr:glycoside hydrolase family 28 protein [Lachnospiraceae bacterium]
MDGIYNILDYRDRSKNNTDWTEAFRAAVSDAGKAGGGIVYVPAGKYATYSIRLESNITLYVAAGAQLDFMEDIEGYETV